MAAFSDLQQKVYKANMEIVELGLVVSTFGNVSGIDRERGVVAIKPSGVPYGELSPENMVLLRLSDGAPMEKGLRPSSDTKTHLRLYREWKGIGGVVHTHSRHATSWAQARRPLPCFGTTHADYFYGTVPCTEVIRDDQIRLDYEEETAVQILDAFQRLDPAAIPAVLVASHGPFTWGKDPAEAVHNSQMLEYSAGLASIALALNPALEPVRQALLDKHYLRKHGKDATYGQQ